jgi:tetratricopeptide (TPR) repeat protein
MAGVAVAEKQSLEAALLLRGSWLITDYRPHEALEMVNQSMSLLRQATRVDQGPEVQAELALAYVQRGFFLARIGQFVASMDSIQEGFSNYQAQNHRLGMAYALLTRGKAEGTWGRPGKEAESLTEALRLLESMSQHRYWFVLHILGIAYLWQGRYQEAQSLLDAVITHFAAFHPPATILAYVWRNRGDLALAMGDLVEADEYFAKSALRFGRAGIGSERQFLVANSGVSARLQGRLEEAEQLFTQSLSTARQVAFQGRIAIALHHLAQLRHDQSRYTEEMALLDEALQIARSIDVRFATALALCQLGHCATALKQPQATRYYAEALQIAVAEEIPRVAVDVVRGVAQWMIEQGNNDGNNDRAVALLRFVQAHPASDFETKRKATQLLVKMEVSVEGGEQVQRLTLQEIAANLLNDYLSADGAR